MKIVSLRGLHTSFGFLQACIPYKAPDVTARELIKLYDFVMPLEDAMKDEAFRSEIENATSNAIHATDGTREAPQVSDDDEFTAEDINAMRKKAPLIEIIEGDDELVVDGYEGMKLADLKASIIEFYWPAE